MGRCQMGGRELPGGVGKGPPWTGFGGVVGGPAAALGRFQLLTEKGRPTSLLAPRLTRSLAVSRWPPQME